VAPDRPPSTRRRRCWPAGSRTAGRWRSSSPAAWGVGQLLIGPLGALADASELRVALGALALLLVAGWVAAAALPKTVDPRAAGIPAAPGP
jgi:hypothetical protein